MGSEYFGGWWMWMWILGVLAALALGASGVPGPD